MLYAFSFYYLCCSPVLFASYCYMLYVICILCPEMIGCFCINPLMNAFIFIVFYFLQQYCLNSTILVFSGIHHVFKITNQKLPEKRKPVTSAHIRQHATSTSLQGKFKRVCQTYGGTLSSSKQQEQMRCEEETQQHSTFLTSATLPSPP